ncbi:MAG: 4Fe-4S dicluster domain-containing protein [Faecalibacterium sp.]|jgi:NAD-dependent dihydropyrimidine dehydrogenase PreA subunit|nr:4Fe-4S dicluster domain-containing protein [Faecalibacterium sp.]
MSIFTNMAMNAIMKTSHPTVDRRQCWNLRPHKEQCTDCMDICPKHIFQRPGVVQDFLGCEDCGLCVSVCRSRCIAPSGEQVEHDMRPLDKDGDCIWIGCDRSARHNDVIGECVGSYTWEMLAYMALQKKLVLDLTPCAECDKPHCVEHVRKVAQRLAEFLGGPLFSARITLAEEPDQAPYHVKEYTRRQMMEHYTEGSKHTTLQLLRMVPGLQDEQRDHALDFRLMLNQRTKQLKQGAEQPLQYGFYLPTVTDACYGCGRCERSCRSEAIKIVDGEDGYSRVVVTPWKCSECGQCVRSCLDKAIEGMTLRQLTTLGPVSVHKLTKVLCSECGKPMKPNSPDGICNICAARIRMQKRREEMARKAEERKKEREEKEAAEAAAKAAEPAAPAETPQMEQSGKNAD